MVVTTDLLYDLLLSKLQHSLQEQSRACFALDGCFKNSLDIFKHECKASNVDIDSVVCL